MIRVKELTSENRGHTGKPGTHTYFRRFPADRSEKIRSRRRRGSPDKEGAARGLPRFKIVHLRDRNYSAAGNLFGGLAFDAGRTTHIGAYEDLAASRYDRDWSAAPRAWAHPGLTAVVVFTDDAPTRRRPLFDVEAVYRNLVVDGVME